MASINTICPFCFNKVALTKLKCECLSGHGTEGTAMEFLRQRVKCKATGCGKDIIRFKCPSCDGELPKSMLHTENLFFSIIGVAASGKTNYITVMLEELNRASNLQFALYSQDVETRTHQRENFKVLYENHKKPEATIGQPPPQIWGIKKLEQNFLQKLSKEVSAYTFIIYDGAGEDHEQITSNPSVCKYIEISKAIMVVMDPMILKSVKDSLSPDIYEKSIGGSGYGGNDKSSIDIVNDMAEFIRKACGLRIGAQIKVPVAVVFTKMDALMDEFKNRTVSMQSPHVSSGYFDYTDAMEVDKDIREWLSVKGEDTFINALKANFADFTFFGVSSYGDVPISKNELNPIRPHRVLDPILWFFAKNNFINVNGMKFNKISRFFWGFRRFLSLQHYIRSKVILAAIIVVLAIVIALANARTYLVKVNESAAFVGASAQAPAITQIEISKWDLKGKDTSEWSAVLVIEKVTSNASGSSFEGYFDWYRSGTNPSGREIFKGTYTSATRNVTIQGTKIENGRNLALGKYVAILSNEGTSLINGTWKGTGSANGVWYATKQTSQTSIPPGANMVYKVSESGFISSGKICHSQKIVSADVGILIWNGDFINKEENNV